MNTDNDNRKVVPEFIVQLMNGCSVQTRVATRLWVALAFVSLLAIMPNQTGPRPPINTKVDLPFSLGKVNRSDFYPFATLVISILIVGFGSANTQSTRSRKLIQKAIVALEDSVDLPGKIYLLDAFDAMTTPSINRTAPLAQNLQGSYQFYPMSQECPASRTLLSAAYYITLKSLSFLVMYCFPAYALISSFQQGGLTSWDARPWNIHVVFFWFAATIALIILLQLFITDILYTKDALKHIAVRWSKK